MRFSTYVVAAAGTSIASAQVVSNGTATSSAALASATSTSCQDAYSLCTASGESRCDSGLTGCKAECDTKYSTCLGAADANRAACAADYAGCLGTNPFTNASGTNTTNSTTASVALGAPVYFATAVVNSLVTVCPASSTITVNGQTYTAGSTASTITVTNCPCTITTPVSSGMATATASGNSTKYTPQPFTGAGSQIMAAGSSVFGLIAGLTFFL